MRRSLLIPVLTATLLFPPQAAPSAKSSSKSAAKAHSARAALVDINHASLAELMRVSGMTPSWAGRIVRFRPYLSKQDLLDQGVVSPQVYARIKDAIVAHRDEK